MSQTFTIERMVAGGWGLSRSDSLVTFVRGGLPGEVVTAAPGERHSDYQFATLKEVQETSPHRVEAPCPVYEDCGGCQFQHVRYGTQLEYKQDMLKEAFSRIGRIKQAVFLDPVPSPLPYEYRRRVRFRVFQQQGTFHLGFVRERSHVPVKGEGCLLVAKSMEEVIKRVEGRLAHLRRLPAFLSHVEIRSSDAFGTHLILCTVPRATRRQAHNLLALFEDVPSVVGCVLTSSSMTASERRQARRVVRGEPHLFERFQDLVFRVSDRSFMQANWAVYSTIFETVNDWLNVKDVHIRVLELHAGVGCIGLGLAKNGAMVTGVEENPYAVADAKRSASDNHVGRYRIRAAKVEDFLETVATDEYDVIIMDPPRAGLSRRCTESLNRINVPRMLYLSCNPSSLARDLNRLCETQYRVRRVRVFDMFPQTAQIETLVELVRA
ncbi:MAG: 23S rRNA (uracil(1939)-C(5))-methyltransferase RlmD [Nitrospira sp.]|nr:23S rRNA (uracil(1939)-C(5))-methyltransferase RlmD [Nitrospira sp.]MDE0404307.1 23S rRNA (uracil(1939)-C(5))-methyltransferase RlmD [Nitrospira sp.]MDE0487424.1 23S rRNA (uracil(1939)-C(5))-methyltransferase RlmD [Nitrospira sp.]